MAQFETPEQVADRKSGAAGAKVRSAIRSMLSNRRVGFASFAVAAVAAVLVTGSLFTTSFAVYIDGENVGRVADQSTVAEAISSVEAQGYTVSSQITYEFGLSLRQDVTTDSSVFEEYLTHEPVTTPSVQTPAADSVADGYMVALDGEVLGVISSQEALNGLLDEIKAPYMDGNVIRVDFVEALTVTPVADVTNFMSLNDLRLYLTSSASEAVTYTAVKGDSFNRIAKKHDMTLKELMAMNPDYDGSSLFVGDVLVVKAEVPRLTVTTTVSTTYTTAVECPVIKVEDDSMYKGTTKVLEQGTEGEALVTAYVTYLNGVETGREIISSSTTTEPTATTMAVGTKEKPKTASTGRYIRPTTGTITSKYGYRYIFGSRSFHTGIDIANSKGTAIKAADGGKVTYSGYKGNYGYLIIITHDNGNQTYYAHCSKLLVSAGERVYQGQVIAKMGSTGRSTGSHLHFEIRINGKHVDPLKYL